MRIFIPIRAIPTERQRITRDGKCYTPERSRKYKAEFRRLFKARYPYGVVDSCVTMEITFFKRCKRSTARNYGDVDNLAKAVMDALIGIVYVDDSQVVELRIKKYVTTGAEGVMLGIEV